jgi:hypothetical protein
MLVVDEASMLDLELTARLLDALPDHARWSCWAIAAIWHRWRPRRTANLCGGGAANAFSRLSPPKRTPPARPPAVAKGRRP